MSPRSKKEHRDSERINDLKLFPSTIPVQTKPERVKKSIVQAGTTNVSSGVQ